MEEGTRTLKNKTGGRPCVCPPVGVRACATWVCGLGLAWLVQAARGRGAL